MDRKYKPSLSEVFFTSRESFSRAEWLALEKSFFSKLYLKNGVTKTTYAERFTDLNALSLNYLPKDEVLEINDVAVSSGISTLEWYELLAEKGYKVNIIGGDISVDAYFLKVFGVVSALYEKGYFPLQFEVGSFRFPVMVVQGILKSLIFNLFQGICSLGFAFSPEAKKIVFNGGAESYSNAFIKLSKVDLISPLLKWEENRHIRIIEDDIFKINPEFTQKFSVLRAANILNLGYFNDQTLMQLLGTLRQRIKPGGLFIVCRTRKSDKLNHATLFRLKENGQFEMLERLREGSEIEHLVLQLPGY
jgi:hypothetical protein